MKAYDSLPPMAKRLTKWAAIGFAAAVVLAAVLMVFVDFWVAFFIALGLYLALIGPLNAAARREHLEILRSKEH
ncbi:hypothetical protein E2F48_10165 [Arthrobacter crusticola]|uniref:Uncharacterized protein n=1 Tax=Arthrobacter crusticola TaxID=2547960 RepID=A0A4R5TWR2_9MICC|nr:hypothetical protein [Arthrobacter crusticola]TDK25601.1 hypothetical protein E2F48_10165 [Arthrobacter crusticola]